MQNEMKSCAVITVNYHSDDLIHALERRVKVLDHVALYVVDNSGDFKPIEPTTMVLAPGRNLGFGRACNLAARKAREETLLFINPDLKISADQIRDLSLIESGQQDLVWGPQIDNGNGYTTCIVSTPQWVLPLARLEYPVDAIAMPVTTYISGACLGVKNEVFRRLTGFAENVFMYGEDLDLCLRAASAGAEIRVIRSVTVKHGGGESSKSGPAPWRRQLIGLRGHFNALRSHFSLVTALLLAASLSGPYRIRLSLEVSGSSRAITDNSGGGCATQGECSR